MTLAAWLHTLSPVLWQITDTLAIRWYGLAYVAGFVVGYFLLVYLAKRRLILIPASRVGDAIMWLVLGVLVGGRLGYVTVYDPSAWVTFTKSFPFWEVFALHHGGMASHGGILGVILASWRISRGWPADPAPNAPAGAPRPIVGRCPPLHIMDITALICPLGLGFGRLANFINGELLGRVVAPPGTPGPAWSVQYPQELKGWIPVLEGRATAPKSPTPLLSSEQFASFRELLASINPDPVRALNTLVDHPARFADQLKPLLASRHASQLYQAAAEGLVLGAVLWLLWAKPRRPGVIGATFLIVYGVLRILTEYWRLPDPQFAEGRPYGLSRGQWLSVGMIAAGALVLYLVKRWKYQPLGGWATRQPNVSNSDVPPPSSALR